MGCTPFAAKVLLFPALRGILFLLVIFGSDSGSWEGSVFAASLGTPLVPLWLLNRAPKYLLFVPAEI